MASLKDLRDRIASVKATQKITGAMQMVAAAKLRRAQERAALARPYAERLGEILAHISTDLAEAEMPALMRLPGGDKVHLAVICTSDRGLCGGFNTQIIRLARQFLREKLAEGKQVKILAVGKKGAEMLKREFGALFIGKIELSRYKFVGFEQARAIADDIMLRCEQREFDICTLFYSAFVSAMQQEPQAERIVPCGQQDAAKEDKGEKSADLDGGKTPPADKAPPAFCEYEPDAADIVGDVVSRNLAARIFRALLENTAGEMGAKMTAMDNATRNAGEMIHKLSVTYNRQRQARITTELIEIIAGAEAL